MKVIGVIAATLLLSSCSEETSSTHSTEHAQLNAKISDLQQELDNLKSSQGTIRANLTDLWIKFMSLSLRFEEEATFDPQDNTGYQKISANVGHFLVSLEDVKPYLDGQKLTFHIGNLNAATFNGFNASLTWGPRYNLDDDNADYYEWKNSLSKKEIKSAGKLQPGKWNKFEATVGPVKAENFGYIAIRINVDTVEMRSN